MLKKFFSGLIVMGILANSCLVSVHAYKFPNAFWKPNDAYVKAIEENNYSDIIKYGHEAIDMMLKEPANEQDVISVIANRAQTLGETYAILGMYDKSAEMFEFLIPYAEKMGWTDSVIAAKAKISEYRTSINLFTDGGTPTFYGAKNEPRNGLLYGVTAESSTRQYLSDSAILIYQELGYQIYYNTDSYLKEAAEKGLAVEFALNCPNEGYDISNFESKKQSLAEISALLKKYSSVPVMFRFGAEMNVWENRADPEQYKEAFRYVSNYFRSNNPNVAIVWSPVALSRWGEDMNDYYPGDEYVDWVGVSLYLTKYFMGNPYVSQMDEIFFKTGINADPILIMEEVIKKYGDRKPIMISESGQSAYVRSGYVNEDTTDWAIQKMKECYYYLPMVYPQIKLMMHFDVYMDNETNNYSLTMNKRLQNQYIDLVRDSRFIKGNSYSSSMCYQPLYNSINISNNAPIYCYPHIYNDNINNVTYFVDGVYNTMASQMPYKATLNLSGLAAGAHTLKAIVSTTSGGSYEKEYTINVQSTQNITVTVNNKKLDFDQPPVIEDGRTLVPLRAIFEALKAKVDWAPETQTVKAVKGVKTITLAVGSNMLYVDGAGIALDVPAKIINSRILVPVRAVSEAFGCSVAWDGATQTVIIND